MIKKILFGQEKGHFSPLEGTMASWYTFAIMALLFLGTQRFFYKVSAEKRCNTALITSSFMATVALLSTTLFFLLGGSVSNIRYLIIIALINSGTFLIATVTHIEALKRIPSGIAYPIIRLNAVVVVLFSVFIFKDRLSPFQVIGIILAMVVIVILTRDIRDKNKSFKDARRGMIFVFISLLCGAGAAISSKFAAIYTNRMAYIAVSYTASTLFSLGLKERMQTEKTGMNQTKAIIYGVLMGLLNLCGYYAFLKALSTGPLSIIASMTGMHFVIAILLSALVYKEALTHTRILGIALTIVSIILLRL